MRILSWNVNGLRAVHKRNFREWLIQSGADIVCLQETKVQEADVPEDLRAPLPYRAYFNFAVRPGYSGVAVYTKNEPAQVTDYLGLERFDEEGRILKLEYPDFTLINLYIPHGGRQKENLEYKLKVYKFLLEYLTRLRDENVILIGDFNIAHAELDLARPKDNTNNIMFTPEERKQIDKLLALGFTDTFRIFHKEGGNYTWWPYFANARVRNLGWRIDYCFTAAGITLKVKDAFILSDVSGSDHCPVGIELKNAQ